jgi:hypothetical protein
VDRTKELITSDLSVRYARNVTVYRQTFRGLDTVVVRVTSPLPVLGLLGSGRRLTVEGHALREAP